MGTVEQSQKSLATKLAGVVLVQAQFDRSAGGEPLEFVRHGRINAGCSEQCGGDLAVGRRPVGVGQTFANNHNAARPDVRRSNECDPGVVAERGRRVRILASVTRIQVASLHVPDIDAEHGKDGGDHLA